MEAELPSVVLVTGADLRPAAPGGTRSYVLGLVQFLAGKGVPVGLISNGVPADIPRGVLSIPVSEEHVASATAFQKRLRDWSRRADWTRFDLVHFQRPDDLAAISDRTLPPSICTLHGDSARGVKRRRGRLAGVAYLRREGAAIPRFRALVAVDETTAEVYLRRYPEAGSRLITIPVAVDSRFLKRQAASLRTSEPTFLFVGRLSSEKRVDLIIDALRASGIPRARLQIAGRGPAEASLRIAAKGLRVEFIGAVPQESLSELYQRADGLVLASEYEGLPTVALEALASGCPVVAPAHCGLDSLLMNGRGILVQHVSDLGAGMASCLELGRSWPRVSLPERFTWPVVGEQILQLYRSIGREGLRRVRPSTDYGRLGPS